MNSVKHDARRLPSLDGLRAVAAMMVVFSHCHATEGWPDWPLLNDVIKTAWTGFLGVQVFFVISGFIITRLLLLEKLQAGAVSLPRFWMRRFLRIIPPLAVYLLCLSLLKAQGAVYVTTLSQVGSLFFFRNHLPESDGLNIHCWSLSVEEQFYLAWPFCVAFLDLKRLRKVALVVMVVALLSRTVTNAFGGTEWRWLIYHADCLMAGALAAVWLQEKGFEVIKPLDRSGIFWHFVALMGILVLSRACATHVSRFVAPIQPTFVAVFVAWWILRLISVREGLTYAILNTRVAIWLGAISYSTYLWQQLVSAPATSWHHGTPWFAHFPLNVPMCIVAGALSYYLLEKPLQNLRRRWDAWVGTKPKTLPAAPAEPAGS